MGVVTSPRPQPPHCNMGFLHQLHLRLRDKPWKMFHRAKSHGPGAQEESRASDSSVGLCDDLNTQRSMAP